MFHHFERQRERHAERKIWRQANILTYRQTEWEGGGGGGIPGGRKSFSRQTGRQTEIQRQTDTQTEPE